MAPGTYRQLQDKHVLVIGGTSGIGYCVAEASLSYGARVTVASSSQARVDKTVDKLKSAYGASSPVQGFAIDLGSADADTEANLEALFKAATADGHAINHVVYTAANDPGVKLVSEITKESIQKPAAMLLYAPVLLAKVAGRYLPPSTASSITLTSGQSTELPSPGWAMVNFYAGGLEALVRSLAVEMGPIRVNIVKPGMVKTERWQYVPDEAMGFYEGLAKKLPVGTMGAPEDVAEAYIWFMKDKFVTGAHASTNGGALIT